MVYNMSMKKIALFCLFCMIAVLALCPQIKLVSFADENDIESVTVLTPTAIYKEASLKSEIYIDNVAANTVLKLDNSSPQTDEMFYKVFVFGVVENTTQSDTGYVLKAHTLDSTITSPSRTLDENGKINNDATPVYEKILVQSTNEYVYQKVDNILLKKDTPISVLDGYEKSRPYTYIAFYGENGDIVRYYVETKNLSVPGINWSIIVAISTLVTCLTILSIIFGIKGRKKKKANA